ncbi:3-oxoacyl-ACP synthase III family protein [Salinispira pacifica]|uniref:3-oxoacyl-[acyl-carrier-protein] synthase, KASIII n=1 Tax=Salinispira pacifica TaxID=1307761 RepID=V5WI91_9SPIO|nr:ketoacyl-ACP synthase III [Salinispira pacifica]AHC15350.1 3-oxoacyl-[acyl-carrier-protein] synthase, KASIII [Salinispira pacifica]
MKIVSTGLYAPGEAIDNNELMKLAHIEFDASRTEEKLGIRQRHIAHLRGMDETSADFAEKAAREAIKESGIDPEEIGLFIVASDTPEYISPATSMIVQGRIQGGQRYTGTYDVNASCSSFVAAFNNASALLKADPEIRYACVIGLYNMPAFVREKDVFGYSIFADGAAAFILENTGETDDRYLGGKLLSDGTQWNYVGVYSGGTRQPVTKERLDSGEYGLQLLQRLPGDRNVKLWPEVVDALLKKVSLERNDIDHFLFTQINRSVIHQVMEILGQDLSKTTTVMDRYGYTGSACIPMAFHEAVKEGRIKRGDRVLAVASGAGLAVASSAFIY